MSKLYRPYYSPPKNQSLILGEEVPIEETKFSAEELAETNNHFEDFNKAMAQTYEEAAKSEEAVSEESVKANISDLVDKTAETFKIEIDDVSNVTDFMYDYIYQKSGSLADSFKDKPSQVQATAQKTFLDYSKKTDAYKNLSENEKNYLDKVFKYTELQYSSTENVKSRGPKTSAVTTGEDNLSAQNEKTNEIKNQMKDATTDTVNKTDAPPGWKDEILKTLFKSIIIGGIIAGTLVALDAIIAYEKTACYYVTPDGNTKLGCHGAYDNDKGQCQCLADIVGSTETDVSDASYGEGSDPPKTIKDYCDGDGPGNNSIQCVTVGGKAVDNCTPDPIKSAYCSEDQTKFYQYKSYGLLDILGDQANWLGNLANEAVQPFQWLSDNFGTVILYVGILIGVLIVIKILSLFFRKKQSS